MTARCPPSLGGASGQLPQPGSRGLPGTQNTRSCAPSTANQPTRISVPNGGSGAGQAARVYLIAEVTAHISALLCVVTLILGSADDGPPSDRKIGVEVRERERAQ